MKPSELLRAAIPFIARGWDDYHERVLSTVGLCEALDQASPYDPESVEARVKVKREIQHQIAPYAWAHIWLEAQGVETEWLQPELQAWRIEWAERMAQWFEKQGE